jgi:alpha-amylase
LQDRGLLDASSQGCIFDEDWNRAVVQKVTRTCYLPASSLLLGLIDRYGSGFKCSFSITGTAVEQLRKWGPEAFERFQKLSDTGSVEFMGETYYHSLFSLFDREEFVEQVRLHTAMMESEFDIKPEVFRNTELLYDDRVSDYVSSFDQFSVLLCEDAVTGLTAKRKLLKSYNGLHILLPRDHRLTDDIAFRFSDREWTEYPLSAVKYATWLENMQESENGDRFVTLYLDYETLGEHHGMSTGIFQFFDDLAEIILNNAHMRLSWPSDSRVPSPAGFTQISVRDPVSWADSGKNLFAWLSGDLQRNVINTLLEMMERARRHGDRGLLEDIRRLSSSDHFYHMYPWSGGADAEVHRYFSPYHSPEDASIRYINALTILKKRLS